MFDKIFQGAPTGAAGGGANSPQSPALGVDTVDGTLLVSYGNGWVPDSGVAAKGNVLSQTSATQANILTYMVPVTGAYLVIGYTTQATATSGTLPEVDVAWTEGDTGVSTTGIVVASGAAAAQGASHQGQYMVYAKAGTNIVVSSQSAATLTYNVRARVQYAG